MLKAGQTVSLAIDKPAAGGRMIGRVDGQVVLVAGAIPGERVRARVERVGKGVAYADTVAIDDPSADRRPGFADPQCGGCAYSHIAYPRQLLIKADVLADAFARIGRMPLANPVTVAASPETGYRMRARLHRRGRAIGFFREATHDLCDPRPTRQLLDATCDALDRLAAAMQSAHLDTVPELELSENVDASERAVFLDTPSAIDPAALERLGACEGLTGVVSASGSAGFPHVSDAIAVGDATIVLRRHVLAFFQGNRHLLGAFVGRVASHVNPGSQVLDLYAGVGLFSLAAAARGAQVTAIEGDRVAAADLRANAEAANGAVVAVHQPVEHFLQAADVGRVPTIIVDPPRSGMSRDAGAAILRLQPSRLVYVSCDVATLARDARHAVDAGYYIDSIEAFDLFPNTPHVETVVVFEHTSQG